ncbi:hypothetical protein G9A89_008624 [Geosiphon pyriformis]|nr:hypothetical protein G9A89_008624 [Geosiphon pyriformis]
MIKTLEELELSEFSPISSEQKLSKDPLKRNLDFDLADSLHGNCVNPTFTNTIDFDQHNSFDDKSSQTKSKLDNSILNETLDDPSLDTLLTPTISRCDKQLSSTSEDLTENMYTYNKIEVMPEDPQATNRTPLDLTSDASEIWNDKAEIMEKNKFLTETKDSNLESSELISSIMFNFNIVQFFKEKFFRIKYLQKDSDIVKSLKTYATFANTPYCNNKSISIRYWDLESYPIIVAIRGNEEQLYSYRKEGLTAQTPYPTFENEKMITVHQEIYRQWSSFQTTFMADLEKIVKKTEKKEFQFVGHGLGGAYAVFASLAFLGKYQRVNYNATVYTYGQPRIGNQYFARFVNKLISTQRLKIFRSTRINDPFVIWPDYPPYVHHATEYLIDADNKICQCDGSENEHCVAAYTFSSDDKHKGPYFGIMMDKCVKNAQDQELNKSFIPALDSLENF